MSPRILGLDWGEKRMGVALTDPLNITAQPLMTIHQKNSAAAFDILGNLIREYDIETVVVGIPLRTDGKESEKAQKVREWMEKAQEKFQGIHFVGLDERFTTVQAGRILHEGGLAVKEQKGHLDKIAAALILEQFLSMKKP